MTELDSQLEQLAVRIDALPRRSQVAIFWAASKAYSAAVSRLSEDLPDGDRVLREALDAAYDFCLGRSRADRAATLLSELDRELPENAIAQGAWICADAALRAAADDAFEAGMSVEYALEPVVGRVSQELFGVWQLGSGESEDVQVAAVMAHPGVLAALEFFRCAVGQLAAQGPPDASLLAQIRTGAAVLTTERLDG